MSQRIETRLVPAAGFRSGEVALCIAQLDDVHAKLVAQTRALTPADLSEQIAPGYNTIGMLLAHIAVAETHLTQVGLRGERDGHVRDVLGIGPDEEGMPLAAGAPPSPGLDGRDIAFFHDLLARAISHAREAAIGLSDVELAVEIVRPPRPDGSVRVFDRRWVLHHMVEHAAGHHGQILLLLHLMRDRR